jgi:two-component system, NtrC family, sensor kinase
MDYFQMLFENTGRLEKALIESKENYNNFIEYVNDILFELDNQGNFTYISPKVEAITGYKPSEVIGLHISNLYYPNETNGFQMGFDYNFEGEIKPRSLRFKNKEGSWKYLRLISLMKMKDGKPDGILGVMTDVTEYKKAEENLKTFKEYFQALTENSEDLIIALKEDGRIQYATKSIVKITGYTYESVIGENIFKYINSSDCSQTTSFLVELSNNPENTGKIQLSFNHRDGSIHQVEVLGKNEIINPSVRSIILNVHDITIRKQTEYREKELEQELHISSCLASIGQLAAGIAHEINNPLTSIIGFSKLLSQNELPEDVAEKIKIINNEAQRIAKIVQGLLTFASQDELKKSTVNINELLSQTLQLREYEMSRNNLKVTKNFNMDLPLIKADPAQLQLVFLNLILNAEKEMTAAHGKGNLIIKTEKANKHVLVSFQDDGPGINPENMPKLFSPFFTTRKIGEGTGLGLSICHGIINRHGGKISVQSKYGAGATFLLELPI